MAVCVGMLLMIPGPLEADILFIIDASGSMRAETTDGLESEALGVYAGSWEKDKARIPIAFEWLVVRSPESFQVFLHRTAILVECSGASAASAASGDCHVA